MKKNQIPAIFGEHTRKATEMNKESLKTTGQPFASYGISVGEVIEFPDAEEDVLVKEQPIRTGSTAMQRLLLVNRNGKPSWLSLGVLNRTDYNRKPTCAFCAEMNDYDNDWARIEALYGKKITVKETVSLPFQKFDQSTGTRIVGQSENRPTPVIVYAE